ncbi:unnamed protein product [Prorocentrum cordatum]|uniref:Potassium channel domain-containing protein n=1 Tax=Prorocentrum cordatum TaxID=2364126 RepID=A0ABN9V7K3_9DINO|nr:unnamed protein product [Polarella glacialis]
MTTVGYGDIVAQNFGEVCFVLVLLLLASVVFASLMGELTDLIRTLNAQKNSLHEEKVRICQYMRWRNVPKKLAMPLRTHLMWLWEAKAGFDTYEEEIKRMLSPVLKQELSYHIYGHMLRSAPFLQWLRMYEPCLKVWKERGSAQEAMRGAEGGGAAEETWQSWTCWQDMPASAGNSKKPIANCSGYQLSLNSRVAAWVLRGLLREVALSFSFAFPQDYGS